METKQRMLIALLQHGNDFRRHYEIRRENETVSEFIDRIHKSYPNWEINLYEASNI